MLHLDHPGVMPRPTHERVARVLLIDADSAFRAELTAALAHVGHEVESAGSGLAGVALARSSRPDVVIFDLRQPDVDGLSLCRLLRAAQSPRPALCVLTAAGDEADRVAAFEAGVDDYVTKPHSTRELILRLRSLARRRSGSTTNRDAIRVGALTVDGAARRVDVAGSAVELTRREFDLLLFLAQRPGRVQSREVLVSSVWGEIADSGRVVDTTVKRLRKKLGAGSPPIKTVRGVGYKLGAE
jgi:two-component system phosphate regulon response regulator PhoB